MFEWKEYEGLLLEHFGASRLDKSYIDHLRNSFIKIEDYWRSHNSNFSIERVIIGEAPLFKNSSYIYNVNCSNTSFLWPSDFPNIKSGDKSYLLKLLVRNKISVVDAYPYAFNNFNTPEITYKKLRSNKHKIFLMKSFQAYGLRRIKAILEDNPNVIISFRYKRNNKDLGKLVDQVIREDSSFPKRFIDLSSKNISIDKEKFEKFLKGSFIN